MSRFISFVLADLSFETRNESENYKMKLLPRMRLDPILNIIFQHLHEISPTFSYSCSGPCEGYLYEI